jgi:cell division protein FtsQ
MSTTPLLSGDVAEKSPADGTGRRGRGRMLIAVAAVAVVVVAAGIWLVAFSPVLGAQSVTVHGTHRLSAAKVRAVAAIKHGTPLVRLDTAAVSRRVEALADVASARVDTSYPATVIITVTERAAVGYLAAGGKYVLVDKTGDQYRTVASKPRALPQFVIAHGPSARAAGRAVATVANALSAGVLARVTSIQAVDPTAVTLLLDDHRIVRWGSADRSADKARILPVLLTQPGTQFDLTNPDQVVTR